MNALIEKILVSELLDVPVAIWLGGIILFIFSILALIVLRVRKIHIYIYSGKVKSDFCYLRRITESRVSLLISISAMYPAGRIVPFAEIILSGASQYGFDMSPPKGGVRRIFWHLMIGECRDKKS